MKKQINAVAAAVLLIIPAVALAGPSVALGYSDIGLSGHSGRPGVQITAGNLYSNNVVASGGAEFARGYYGFHAELGKMISAGGVSFTPYVSMGFLSLNYSQQPQPFQQSILTSYALAGVNLNVPIGQNVALEFGGGYGHTLTTFSGSGGSVYKGKAEIGFEVAHNVTTNINVSYLHVPGASLTNYGAGISYHFS
ncbi:hypothetical protein BBC27_05790 [Acidithiobacillus ferrivorans]|uniref:Outer membrane protein beta-barrel domain-containing protein n=1 Tax=Acidithiobacillus ferrivorans TaxID=160808 RepID=A0A1B9C1Q7_9PROT|nr:hypothetical protein [Acidithiobacillus ferrivorans]OCB03906.1 hypothetical protein BBC27_05790 [Acidithiobacillus ferrivorans]